MISFSASFEINFTVSRLSEKLEKSSSSVISRKLSVPKNVSANSLEAIHWPIGNDETKLV